jgi:tRNA A-37 threonylcarbamoyl transferase component Bud32
MSTPRIGDRDLAVQVTGRASSRATSASARLGAALASPVGILIFIPGLVAAVGLLLTALGQDAIRQSSFQLGRDRFAEQTDFIARGIAASLAQADPLLDRMGELVRGWSPTTAVDEVAPALRGLMQGRPGVAYVSISYPDGTFRGAHLDRDGHIRFKEARLHEGARRMTTFDFVDQGGVRLVPRPAEATSYDPRTRDFYRLAVAERRRVWTPVYQFFGSNQTGVTRTEAVFADGHAAPPGSPPLAVLTADFDVHALSASMAHTPLAGTRTLLYTGDGTLLAYPEGAAAIARIPTRNDRPISHRDLGDPVIDAFFAAVAGRTVQQGDFTHLSGAGDAALAMVASVPGFPELRWNVAAIVPSRSFFAARIVHERHSLLAAAAALLAALALAVVFSRHVVRVRAEAAFARRLAREAGDRARDLGSYRLVERLGEGGMGEVWRAEHRLLVRQAAIKLIRPDTLATMDVLATELRERFRREAQTLASLHSRHTIELFDYGVTEDGTFYIVMELLDGMDLATVVARHGPQPAGRVIHLMTQVCSSLAEAHAAGMVHRDMKPANIFVCRAADEVDVVKVLDFGLVQAHGDASRPPEQDSALAEAKLTHASQALGTPAFMAPEQLRGLPTDGRADLYSLACTAVWLLSGRLPFEGSTTVTVLAGHLFAPVPELPALMPGYFPPELDGLLRQCLEKAPEDRPADAATLARSLRAIALPPEEVWTDERAHRWWAERSA